MFGASSVRQKKFDIDLDDDDDDDLADCFMELTVVSGMVEASDGEVPEPNDNTRGGRIPHRISFRSYSSSGVSTKRLVRSLCANLERTVVGDEEYTWWNELASA
jgi:hypothetical protein